MVAQFRRQLPRNTVNLSRIRRTAQVHPRNPSHILRIGHHTRQQLFFVLETFHGVRAESFPFIRGQKLGASHNAVPTAFIRTERFKRRSISLFTVATAAGQDFIRPRIHKGSGKRQQMFDFKFRAENAFRRNLLAAKRTTPLCHIGGQIFP